MPANPGTQQFPLRYKATLYNASDQMPEHLRRERIARKPMRREAEAAKYDNLENHKRGIGATMTHHEMRFSKIARGRASRKMVANRKKPRLPAFPKHTGRPQTFAVRPIKAALAGACLPRP
jgi:hypothetical protein